MSFESKIGCCQSCMGSGIYKDDKLCQSCLGTGYGLRKEFYEIFKPYHDEYAKAKKEGLTISEYAYSIISDRILKNKEGKKYPNICPYCKSKVQHIGANGVQYICGFFKCTIDKLHRPHARTEACRLIALYRLDYENVRRFYSDIGEYYRDCLDNRRFLELHEKIDEID